MDLLEHGPIDPTISTRTSVVVLSINHTSAQRIWAHTSSISTKFN